MTAKKMTTRLLPLVQFLILCISLVEVVQSLSSSYSSTSTNRASSTASSPTQLLPCPPTKWKSFQYTKDVHCNLQKEIFPSFLQEIKCPENTQSQEEEVQWLSQNRNEIMNLLQKHGAIHFTNFSTPKTKQGFKSFCNALPLQACEDALASIGVRSSLSKSNGIYRAVDSESLADTFIGLHNDCTFALAPPFAAFCCFQQANENGEFLLADGKRVLQSLEYNVLEKLHQRQLRVRVAAIPTPFLLKSKGTLQTRLSYMLYKIANWGVKTFLPKLGLELAYSNDYTMLQIFEPKKSPINVHPITNQATFFSGIHSQSAYLQQMRAADTFKGVAITDVFYGEVHTDIKDGSNSMLLNTEYIEDNVLNHIEKVMNEQTAKVLMKPGEVVLLDSYQTLHGRNIFKGPREHGVVWLTNDQSKMQTFAQQF